MAAKKKPRACGYCGSVGANWTDDHAIPECLWDGENIEDPVLVPCCLKCNNYWSRFEGYFRTMAALFAVKSDHPVVRRMVTDSGTVQRHFQEDRKLHRQLLESLRSVPITDDKGYLIDEHQTVDLDWRQWWIVVGKMVRGLYWEKRKSHLPLDYEVRFWPGEGFWEDPLAAGVVKALEEPPWFGLNIGDTIFKGKIASAETLPDAKVYLLGFFNTVFVLAWTAPIGREIVDPSHPQNVAKKIKEYEQFAKAKRDATGPSGGNSL